MNFKIVSLSKEYISFIQRVYEQNIPILHGTLVSLKEWRNYFAGNPDPHEMHFIIINEKEPVGWLKFNGLDKPEICISMLVIDDKFKHKGAGRFALQFSELYAKENNKTAIILQTTKDSTIAVNFYLKYGYEIIREMIYKVGDGVDREGYEFKKIIK
jgi:ribosomal protein S18 acetylase RimI-like enzyme